MGTYAWVAAGAVLLLGIVLWFGPALGAPTARVGLEPGSRWTGATLDDGDRMWEVRPDAPAIVPTGSYLVMLFDAEGDAHRFGHLILVDGSEVQLGEVDASSPEGAGSQPPGEVDVSGSAAGEEPAR